MEPKPKLHRSYRVALAGLALSAVLNSGCRPPRETPQPPVADGPIIELIEPNVDTSKPIIIESPAPLFDRNGRIINKDIFDQVRFGIAHSFAIGFAEQSQTLLSEKQIKDLGNSLAATTRFVSHAQYHDIVGNPRNKNTMIEPVVAAVAIDKRQYRIYINTQSEIFTKEGLQRNSAYRYYAKGNPEGYQIVTLAGLLFAAYSEVAPIYVNLKG